jgi:glycosyltransferase involved in cell wall biosynthesis
VSRAGTLFINGRFLTRPVGGVERYAREIVRCLDEQLAADPAGGRAVLLAPGGAVCDLDLHAIRFAPVGAVGGHLWEQMVLPVAAAPGRLLSLANSGPIAHPRQLAVVHDAGVFRRPRNYRSGYRTLHRTLGRALARTARTATVSAFSRRELAQALGIEPRRILVAPGGAEHLGRIAPDATVLDRLGLRGRRFFLVVGAGGRDKNLALALAAWARAALADARLVVVGGANPRVFSGCPRPHGPGVVAAGALDDAAVAALYAHAAALVFPSRYEGFGLPPLEAMAAGCPVLAADIAPVREVCGEVARYFHPDDAAGLAALLAAPPTRTATAAGAAERARRFSWRDSARRLLEATRAL